MAIEFSLPEGFNTPQDVEPGSTFDAVASLKLEEDGSVELVSLDGVPVGDDKEEESDKAEAGESDNAGNSFVNAVGAGAGQQ